MKELKKVILIFIALFILISLHKTSFAKVEVEWSDSELLTKRGGWSNYPKIALYGENIHVVWCDSSSSKRAVFYMKSTNNGIKWSKPKRLTNLSDDYTKPAIAVHKKSIHVVYERNANIYYRRSINNGKTWFSEMRMTWRIKSNKHPTIAVYKETIHLAWRGYEPWKTDVVVYYKKSNNNGKIWSSEKDIAGYYECYEPTIASVKNNVHIAWEEFSSNNNKIRYKRSRDKGKSWGGYKFISKELGGYDPAKNATIVSDRNEIHIIWQQHVPTGPSKDGIFYSYSIDNGSNWSEQENLSTKYYYNYFYDSDLPAIAVYNRKIHAVWCEDRQYPLDREICYRKGELKGN